MDGTSQRVRTPRWVVAAVVAFIISITISAWGLVGDLSEPGGYLQIVPIKLAPAGERALLPIGISAGIISTILLVIAFTSRRLDPRWLAVITTLGIAAVAMGFGGRVLAAETDGANIGGGILIMFGGPLLLILLGAAGLMSRRIGRSS